MVFPVKAMDKKILAVAVVAVVVVAAVGVYYLYNSDTDEDDFNIIARVNTEGSGIFLNAGENPDDYLKIVRDAEPVDEECYIAVEDYWIVFYPENWGGKVFADPGTGSIQHVQLQQIVTEYLGLEFKLYTTGTTLSSDTVYYVPNVGTYADYELQRDANNFVGGFIWEAQYSIALENGCESLILTNVLFPNHTCCVVGASNDYITTHSDETVRFLAAYIEAVERMIAAIADQDSEDFETLMAVAIDKVSMPDTMTDDQKREAIISALSNVTYTYCDDAGASDPLYQLKEDIADLVEDFLASGVLTTSYTDVGYDSAADLAADFVKSDYIIDAIAGNYSDDYETASITVAVITGDIHQLAIHYGMELGIFEDYGLDITIVYQTNGPGVFSALSNGTAQFGFIGAPPMTTNSINTDAIGA